MNTEQAMDIQQPVWTSIRNRFKGRESENQTASAGVICQKEFIICVKGGRGGELSKQLYSTNANTKMNAYNCVYVYII